MRGAADRVDGAVSPDSDVSDGTVKQRKNASNSEKVNLSWLSVISPQENFILVAVVFSPLDKTNFEK